MTLPLTYAAIRQHPPLSRLYAERLQADGIVTAQEVAGMQVGRSYCCVLHCGSWLLQLHERERDWVMQLRADALLWSVTLPAKAMRCRPHLHLHAQPAALPRQLHTCACCWAQADQVCCCRQPWRLSTLRSTPSSRLEPSGRHCRSGCTAPGRATLCW